MADLNDQAVHPDDAKREVNRSAALTLRMAGNSYRKIALAIGISHVTAQVYVEDALAEVRTVNREKTEELRALELARIDDLWRRLYPALPNSKVDAETVRTLLRLSQHRSALLGLIADRGLGGGHVPYVGPVDLNRLTVGELLQFEALLLRATGLQLEAGPAADSREVAVVESHEVKP